jgi:hypothetical protein
MSQPHLNFPDPAEPNSEASPAAGEPDQILSQLAGQEIDRLLAEVDEKFDARLGRRGAASSSSSAESKLALRRYPAPRIADAPEPDLSDFFEELDKAPRRRPREMLPNRPPPPATLEEELEEHEASTALQRRALDVPLARRPGDLAAHDLHVPIIFRPLQWLNLPFAGVSPSAMPVVGALAILCFLSSLGALAYVLMLRQP